ncbi:MAG: hypothetical protein LW855_04100 [Alphaproteobacteria bacterium]|jgi:hypothetical protein|nr:hypothetical protein [Thalassospira sp.]MCE2964951.1 hypothetical protein [Alphaproteobacteria bacterium]
MAKKNTATEQPGTAATAGAPRGSRTPPGNGRTSNTAPGKQANRTPQKGKTAANRTKKAKVNQAGIVANAVVLTTMIPNVGFNVISTANAQLPSTYLVMKDLDSALIGLVGLSSPLSGSFSEITGFNPEEIVNSFYSVASGILVPAIQASINSENSAERELGFIVRAFGETGNSLARVALKTQPQVPQPGWAVPFTVNSGASR